MLYIPTCVELLPVPRSNADSIQLLPQLVILTTQLPADIMFNTNCQKRHTKQHLWSRGEHPQAIAIQFLPELIEVHSRRSEQKDTK